MKRRFLWFGLSLFYVFALACQPRTDFYSTEPLLIITKNTTIKAIPEYGARDIIRVSAMQRLVLIRSVGEWYEIRMQNGRSGFVHSSVAKIEHKEGYILLKKLGFHIDARPDSRVKFWAAPGTQIFTLKKTKNNMIHIWTKNRQDGWIDYQEFFASAKRGRLPAEPVPSGIAPSTEFGVWFVYEPFLITDETGKTYSLLPGQNVLKKEVSQRGYEITLPNGLTGWTPSAKVASISGKPVITTVWTDCYGSLGGNSKVDFRFESGTALMITGYENGYYRVNAAGKNTDRRKTEKYKLGARNRRTGYVSGIGLKPIKFQLATVVQSAAKLRFEPQSSSAEVTTLTFGEEIICLDLKNEWWHIVTGGSNKDGWVRQENIALPEWGYGVALQNVDIHLKGPGSQYHGPVHQLKGGDFVPLLEKWGDGYQVPVSEKEKLGWILTQDVVTASFRPLIVTAKETQVRRMQKGGRPGRKIPRGTELIELRQEGAYHLVTTFSWDYGYVPAEDVAVMRYADIHILPTDKIRFGPGEQYQLRPQTGYWRNVSIHDVSIIDYFEDWLQVDFGNNSGWIHADINKRLLRR